MFCERLKSHIKWLINENNVETVVQLSKGDRKKVGVQAEIRRSQMFYNIVSLIREGAISLEDLDGFSEELKQATEASMNW